MGFYATRAHDPIIVAKVIIFSDTPKLLRKKMRISIDLLTLGA